MTSSNRGEGSAVRRWAVWPCDHGGVEVEEGRVPRGYQCAECGARSVPVIAEEDIRAALDARQLYDDTGDPIDEAVNWVLAKIRADLDLPRRRLRLTRSLWAY